MTIRHLVTHLAATGVLLAAPVALAGPATAAPPDREKFVEPYHDTVEDWCGVAGLDVVVDGTATVHESVRRRGGFEFFQAHLRIVETHSVGDAFTTYRERSVIKDLKVRSVGDTLEILILGAGNATLSGPGGRVIARDPGQSRFLLIIDADTGEEISFDRVKGSTGRSDDFCAAEVPLLQG